MSTSACLIFCALVACYSHYIKLTFLPTFFAVPSFIHSFSYQITAICDCAESCLRALLSEPLGEFLPRESELRREPNHSAREALYEVSNLAGKQRRSLVTMEAYLFV